MERHNDREKSDPDSEPQRGRERSEYCNLTLNAPLAAQCAHCAAPAAIAATAAWSSRSESRRLEIAASNLSQVGQIGLNRQIVRACLGLASAPIAAVYCSRDQRHCPRLGHGQPEPGQVQHTARKP